MIESRLWVLQDLVQQPLSGWFGHARPFAFEPSFDAAPGIQRFQCGTPPIISLAALEVSTCLKSQRALQRAGHVIGAFLCLETRACKSLDALHGC